MIDCVKTMPDGSITFANFVDFDQSFGHRRDVSGYARRAGGVRCPDTGVAGGAEARRPGGFHGRSWLRSHHARQRSYPRIVPGAGLRPVHRSWRGRQSQQLRRYRPICRRHLGLTETAGRRFLPVSAMKTKELRLGDVTAIEMSSLPHRRKMAMSGWLRSMTRPSRPSRRLQRLFPRRKARRAGTIRSIPISASGGARRHRLDKPGLRQGQQAGPLRHQHHRAGAVPHYLIEQLTLLAQLQGARSMSAQAVDAIPLTFAVEKAAAAWTRKAAAPWPNASHCPASTRHMTPSSMANAGGPRPGAAIAVLRRAHRFLAASAAPLQRHRARSISRASSFSPTISAISTSSRSMPRGGRGGRALRFVEPGNRVIERARSRRTPAPGQAAADAGLSSGAGRRLGVTLINIGVGPSNAKTVTDHLAVLRPMSG